MALIRRGRPTQGFTVLRVAFFFLAAGLWLAGVRIGSDLVTAIAIGVAAAAILFSVLLRRLEEAREAPEEGPGE